MNVYVISCAGKAWEYLGWRAQSGHTTHLLERERVSQYEENS